MLLVHHFHESNPLNTELPIDVLQCNVHCQETATKAIYISLTIKSCHKKQNKRNFSSLLAAHALSGCDTVRRTLPRMYGIGKKKALQFLRAQYGIENLGKTHPNILWETIENASIKFVCGLPIWWEGK